ncbi:MAG: hypothetical protein LBI72_01040 [Flavobacteriaceae bacterium]|jgi:hypothetical protein|nr:hypothetical protein [Flavobacteriaceae bacterium]
MKSFFKGQCILLFTILGVLNISAQSTATKGWLSDKEKITLFTPAFNEQMEIEYPIFKAFKYSDNGGDNLFVFTEHAYAKQTDDSLNDKIKGHFIQRKKGEDWKQVVTVRDLKTEGEENIWFWTKYSVFEDADKDGIIDPIVVYGSSDPDNGRSEGRLKIIVIYKGAKVFIRHQNSIMDNDRITQVDKAFYQLPKAIQKRVQKLIKDIADKDLALFAHTILSDMDKGKTSIN